MPSKAQEYRRKAEEADKAAEAARDPATRSAYQNIAESYRELASLRERNANN